MVKTTLENNTLQAFFNDESDADKILTVTKKHLDSAGTATVKNTTKQELDSTQPNIDYPYEIRLRFDITNEDSIILIEKIKENIRQDPNLEDLDLKIK